MVPSRTQGYDAIVVGAGLSGGTLAYRPAKRDLRVLVLERGDFLRLPPWRAGDPIGIHIRSAPARPSVVGGPTKFYGTAMYRMREIVGGPTKFYGAAMYRMRESDFRAIHHEAGESPAWPITYNDLEPYYCEAEELYRVHGSTEEDPTEPPHSMSYPYPPLPHAPMVSELVDRLRNSGTTVSPMPRALDYGPGGKCVLCSTCDAYYCRLDAKMDADVAALRPAIRSGRVDLVTQARCLRILTNERGTKTTGVLMERDEKQETVHANIVAVCAGLGPSAALLLDSRTSRHPAGLGNSTGCVGRYYGGHDTGMVFPLLSFTGSLPPMHTKTFSINTYYNGAPDWPYPMGVIQAAGQVPFWQAEVVPWWKKAPARLVGKRSIFCFFMTEALPTRESGFVFDGERIVGMRPPVRNVNTFKRFRLLAIDLFKRAGYQVVAPHHRSLWHRVGTVCFGMDPESSVLDANCKVHEIDGLYVVDASVLPSAGAVGTALTIAALALRVGDAITGVEFDGRRRAYRAE